MIVPDKAIMEPTEMSISPSNSTMVMVMATMPLSRKIFMVDARFFVFR